MSNNIDQIKEELNNSFREISKKEHAVEYLYNILNEVNSLDDNNVKITFSDGVTKDRKFIDLKNYINQKYLDLEDFDNINEPQDTFINSEGKEVYYGNSEKFKFKSQKWLDDRKNKNLLPIKNIEII